MGAAADLTSALAEAAVAVGAVAVGYLARGPVRTWLLRVRGSRRYRARLKTLEAPPDHDEQPDAGPLITTRDLPEELAASITSRFPYFYVAGLHLQSLRCFLSADLDFRFPGEQSDLLFPNVNLLLGNNGTGKTTILRAIAIAALGPVLRESGFVANHLVTQGRDRAHVAASFVFGGPTGRPVALPAAVSVVRRDDLERVDPLTEGSYWDDLFKASSPSFFIVGYGTYRRVSNDPRADPALERSRRTLRYQRVASLLDDTASLVPLGAWLPQADVDRQEEISDLMKNLLPQGAHFTGRFEGSEPVFRRKGFDLPFPALSDGFRSYIGWLGDLLFHMSTVAPPGVKLGEIGGIALVDEVDLLLHPEWQRVVVSALSRLLPKVQFIFTTHSPIVAGTLQAENVIVSREEEGDRGLSVVERIDAEIHGLTAEQVLLSSYFELPTTRAPDTATALDELAQRAVQGDAEATRRYLRALAGTEPFSPREPDQ